MTENEIELELERLAKEYQAQAEKLEAAAIAFKEELDRIFRQEQEAIDQLNEGERENLNSFKASVDRLLLITSSGFWGKGLIPPMSSSSQDKPKSEEIKVTENYLDRPGIFYVYCDAFPDVTAWGPDRDAIIEKMQEMIAEAKAEEAKNNE